MFNTGAQLDVVFRVFLVNKKEWSYGYIESEALCHNLASLVSYLGF